MALPDLPPPPSDSPIAKGEVPGRTWARWLHHLREVVAQLVSDVASTSATLTANTHSIAWRGTNGAQAFADNPAWAKCTSLSTNFYKSDGGSDPLDAANDNFVCPAAGIYHVSAHWQFSDSPMPGGFVLLGIGQNGSVTRIWRQDADALSFQMVGGSAIFNCAAGDSIAFYVWNDSPGGPGASINLEATTSQFSIHWVCQT